MNSRLDGKEKLFLSHLDADGTARGNKALREALRWGEKAYFEVRSSLLAKGAIALGRGRGGSVRRVAEDDDQALLARVPVDGSTISNPKLIELLNWPRTHYWEVRNRLVERGDLCISKGRGGTVFRAIDERKEREGLEELEEEEREELEEGREELDPIALGKSARVRNEARLYQPLARVLGTDWASVQDIKDPLVAISAYNGKGKRTGGTWSRPDVIVVGVRSFDLLIPEQLMEVWTFEVKAAGWNMKAIHEANANGRHATHACALLQVEREAPPVSQIYTKEAKRIGVGLITFIEADEWETWETLVLPERKPPLRDDVVHFLEEQIPSEIGPLKEAWRERQISRRNHSRSRNMTSGNNQSCV